MGNVGAQTTLPCCDALCRIHTGRFFQGFECFGIADTAIQRVTVVLHLASLGAAVLAADRDFGKATEFGEELTADSVDAEIRQLGGRAVTFSGDLSDALQARAMVRQCTETLGAPDILVNNAGGVIAPMDRSAPTEVPEDDVRRLFDVNYMTMLHCCQAAGLAMKQRGSGAIVNMSSCAARFILPGGRGASYGAFKAAVSHYSRSLALELAPADVRVNSIAPSIILTSRILALAQERGIGRPEAVHEVPLGRYGTPQDVAFVVEFLVTELSQYVTGQSISVCGGKHLKPAWELETP